MWTATQLTTFVVHRPPCLRTGTVCLPDAVVQHGCRQNTLVFPDPADQLDAQEGEGGELGAVGPRVLRNGETKPRVAIGTKPFVQAGFFQSLNFRPPSTDTLKSTPVGGREIR